MDGSMLLIVCVEQPGPEARPDVCPVVSRGTLPLTRVGVCACVCGRVAVCMCTSPTTTHTHACLLCVYLCASLPPGAPLTQSASALIPEGADGGAARALPCPPNTRSC